MFGSPAPARVVRNHSARLMAAVQRIVRRVRSSGDLPPRPTRTRNAPLIISAATITIFDPEQLRRRVGVDVGGKEQHAADDHAGQADDDDAVDVVDAVDLLPP